jgi:hypothetical protein
MKPKKIDPKYLGIPNICFSLTDPNDSREKLFEKQRIERGFDESELWSLTDTIANFIIPRLEEYQSMKPVILTQSKQEKKQIDDFLMAMKLIARNGGTRIWNESEKKIVESGMKHFHKFFLSLWW